MRQLVTGLLGVVLIMGMLPAMTQARSARPGGLPLLWYVVHFQTYPLPAPQPASPPPVCVLTPGQACNIAFSAYPLGSFTMDDCTPDAFATREEAEAAAQGLQPPGDWYVVQAIDAPHALAAAQTQALLAALVAHLPADLPAEAVAAIQAQAAQSLEAEEDSFAQVIARLCAGGYSQQAPAEPAD